MREYLVLALELRRRVKEQLKRMGGIEYSKVNFSYIDKETGQESFVTCKELGALQIIPDTPLSLGTFSPWDTIRQKADTRCSGSRSRLIRGAPLQRGGYNGQRN